MAKKDQPPVQKLDDDQLRDLTNQHITKYQQLLAKKKAADADLRNLGKVIKSDLGDFGLDSIKLAVKLREGAESATNEEKEKVLQTLRVMRWEGIPLGVQGNLFEVFDDRPLDERAFELGRADGMSGKSMKPPVELVGTQGPAFEEYCRGWHLGQEKIFAIREPAKSKAKDEDGEGAAVH